MLRVRAGVVIALTAALLCGCGEPTPTDTPQAAQKALLMSKDRRAAREPPERLPCERMQMICQAFIMSCVELCFKNPDAAAKWQCLYGDNGCKVRKPWQCDAAC